MNFFLCHVREQNGRTVDALLDPYLRTKSNPIYRHAQATALRVFATAFGLRPVQAITASEIEAWLDQKGWQSINRRNYIRDIWMFFNWAKRHDYVTDNPCEKIRRPRVQLAAPAIYTVDEAHRLQEAATLHKDLELLPMIALCFFSGIGIAEAERLTWEMIDWEEGKIRLPGAITKNGRRRNIESWIHCARGLVRWRAKRERSYPRSISACAARNCSGWPRLRQSATPFAIVSLPTTRPNFGIQVCCSS